jgi:hypothetical protein
MPDAPVFAVVDHHVMLVGDAIDILADAFNLGLEKMADACPGTSMAKLSWLVARYIRDETSGRDRCRERQQHGQASAKYGDWRECRCVSARRSLHAQH